MHSNTDTDTEIPTEQCHTDTDTGKGGGGMETVCNSITLVSPPGVAVNLPSIWGWPAEVKRTVVRVVWPKIQASTTLRYYLRCLGTRFLHPLAIKYSSSCNSTRVVM